MLWCALTQRFQQGDAEATGGGGAAGRRASAEQVGAVCVIYIQCTPGEDHVGRCSLIHRVPRRWGAEATHLVQEKIVMTEKALLALVRPHTPTQSRRNKCLIQPRLAATG
jgi:hypothetical protein